MKVGMITFNYNSKEINEEFSKIKFTDLIQEGVKLFYTWPFYYEDGILNYKEKLILKYE